VKLNLQDFRDKSNIQQEEDSFCPKQKKKKKKKGQI
jgi:hypothetical protein